MGIFKRQRSKSENFDLLLKIIKNEQKFKALIFHLNNKVFRTDKLMYTYQVVKIKKLKLKFELKPSILFTVAA